MPSLEQFLEDFDELLEQKHGTIRADSSLEKLDGWNSMALLGFLALADEKYAVSVKPARLQECRTVSDLYNLVAPATA